MRKRGFTAPITVIWGTTFCFYGLVRDSGVLLLTVTWPASVFGKWPRRHIRHSVFQINTGWFNYVCCFLLPRPCLPSILPWVYVLHLAIWEGGSTKYRPACIWLYALTRDRYSPDNRSADEQSVFDGNEMTSRPKWPTSRLPAAMGNSW